MEKRIGLIEHMVAGHMVGIGWIEMTWLEMEYYWIDLIEEVVDKEFTLVVV